MRTIDKKLTNKEILDKFYNLGWYANFLDSECEYLNEFIQFVTCNYDEIAIALIKDNYTELKKYKSKFATHISPTPRDPLSPPHRNAPRPPALTITTVNSCMISI